MNRLTFREPLALALLLVLAAPALAQVAAPRTLSELKTEVQGRADRHAYCVLLAERMPVKFHRWTRLLSIVSPTYTLPLESTARVCAIIT